MPFQVQGSIDGVDTYEPIVTVPASGEVITQNALADTAVALGRRIQYVKNRVDEEFEDPFTRATITDDFQGVKVATAEAFIWTDSGVWTTNGNADGTLSGEGAGEDDHPGVVQAFTASNPFKLTKQVQSVRMSDCTRAICHVKVSAGVGDNFEFGWVGGTAVSATAGGTGVDTLSVIYEAGVSGGRWRYRCGNTAGDTRTDSGATASAGWHRLEITRTATAFSFSANGGATAVVSATQPSALAMVTPFIRGKADIAGGFTIDAVHFKASTPTRGA